MSTAIYESDRLLAEYLLFHYGEPEEILPWPGGPRDALDFAVRSVRECLAVAALPPYRRALDLGCAVGRSTFELARDCHEVTGIDFSCRFIEAADALRQTGEMPYHCIEEGEITTPLMARVPAEIDRTRVTFEIGDAMRLRANLGAFDIVHAANLLDRLTDPLWLLKRLPALVKPGGQLILTTPCTWLEDFTPRDRWLGGREGRTTLDALRGVLARDFDLAAVRDLPFLIREHARKYQWSVAQATTWRRK